VSEEFRDLQKSAAELPPVEEMLASCCSALAKKEDEIPTLKQDIERWTGELEDSSRWEIEFQSTQAHLSQLRAEREIFARSLAVSEAQMKQMNDRLCELTERKIELELIRAEIDDFLFLAEAFGKKGIQAVIIENAVPEIEAEANRILARLTDNKMHVAMVTRQRTKSGTVSETLDLLIGDEIGTRNYELYSGGEAFKINFAIRVALSRLLARRSGAKLETLIIDEGFGSQDDLSRDRLVTAIRSIQKEFARILVITHMPDVREMFPMQIQVSKVNGVSTVQMVC
jgi:exonuclease SbcC